MHKIRSLCLTNPMKLTCSRMFRPSCRRIFSVLWWNISTTLGVVANFSYNMNRLFPMFQKLIVHMIEGISSIIMTQAPLSNPNSFPDRQRKRNEHFSTMWLISPSYLYIPFFILWITKSTKTTKTVMKLSNISLLSWFCKFIP